MKKMLPIGREFFDVLMSRNFYYVDKTIFIKELLEAGGYISLITRPRRFGKTLNMSMLSCFFDIRRDSKELFAGLNIMGYENFVEKHMNKYPVIFISLKDITSSTAKVEKIREAAVMALEQVNKQGYSLELRAEGYGVIYEYGIAFNGKHCIVEVKLRTGDDGQNND